jgi:alanine racemase
MDQFMVDLTDVKPSELEEAMIFGGSGSPSVEEFAEQLNTVPHEVICDLSRRVPRVYKQGGKIFEVIDYLLFDSKKDTC